MEKVFKTQKMERREITIGEARPLLTETEMEKHLNSDTITKEAIEVRDPTDWDENDVDVFAFSAV